MPTFAPLLILKCTYMTTVLLLKDLYAKAFKNISNFLVKYYFKVLFWLCVATISIVLYAFVFRLSTGFAF
jgi:hypothetical protein